MLDKNLAGILALAGVFVPGLQRFYMGHRRWGIGFLVVGAFVLPFFPVFFQILSYALRLFCVFEGLWLVTMDNIDFHARFNPEQTQIDWTSAKQRKGSDDPEQQLEMMYREGILNADEYRQQKQRIRDSLRKP